MSYTATTTRTPSTADVRARGGEFERSVDATGVFFIARRHLRAVLLYHVSLKIDLRAKHDEFARLADGIEAWMVRLLKVFLLRTMREVSITATKEQRSLTNAL
jgi:hypothetical protein